MITTLPDALDLIIMACLIDWGHWSLFLCVEGAERVEPVVEEIVFSTIRCVVFRRHDVGVDAFDIPGNKLLS